MGESRLRKRKVLSDQGDTLKDPSDQGDTLKKQWVYAVSAFWVTILVLIAVYVLQGKINLILVSIALGTMFLGLFLKTRYQLHQRKEQSANRSKETS